MNELPCFASQLESWQVDANILEQDKKGIKVMRLANGNILKIFRIRGWSSSRIYSYAQRFRRNAIRLKSLSIATVTPVAVYHFRDTTHTAIEYQPLEGVTIRDVLKQGVITAELAVQVGRFIALVHQKGIYFRSFHFGNIVLTPEHQLGLIDIADIRIYPWGLQVHTRVRSIKRMLRYKKDLVLMGNEYWKMMIDAYVKQTGVRGIKQSLLRKWLPSSAI